VLSKDTSSIPTFLDLHNISPWHRSRMVDWMIQVLRVLKVSCDFTYFLAISLMDRYFEQK